MNIKDLVKGDKHVDFTCYRDGDLWYRHEDGLEFPVPVSDVGGATMLARDRAIFFMRYMRKHIEMLAAAKTGIISEKTL
jgi:hypothetical protein